MIIEQIEQNLLFANNLSVGFLKQCTQKLLNKDVDFCDLYLQNATTESWSIDEDIIKSGSFAINQGIGVRAVCNDKSFLSYSSAMSASAIAEVVDNLFIETATNKVEYLNQKQQEIILANLYTKQNSICLYDSIYKTNILKQINQLGRSRSNVDNVIANLSLENDEVVIIRSDNKISSDIRPLVHISITIIVKLGQKIEKGYSGFGGRYLLEDITTELIALHVEKAYNQAILKCEAVSGPQGQLPVVLGNGWAGVILHEAVGHGLEGDFNRKGSSAFSNKIGQKVAHESVTVIDDGTIPNRRGSLNIDDEGNHTQRNILIENGILKGYMFDELNARLMGTQSTGNGRRESFACNPMPRMTNTFMLGGNHTHEEIIASIDNGLYAESFEGGQVDITSGQFVFNANMAWVIKNGKLSHPVKGCALVGSGPECLKYVSMVGNNLELDPGIGVCGKSGQSVPVGVGQPTIRIDNGLVVGGA
ncbi:MAG: metalloprotease TldD [Burkholderiales bacterium]|nr:metalloprotease TldD [Burkholderiales bacterium]